MMSSGSVELLGKTLLLSMSILLAGCDRPAPQAAPAPPAPPPVTVAAAIEKDIVEADEFSGRIEAVDQVEVRARITGYIQSVDFKQGAAVKKGDVLFHIDPRSYEAQVARAEAQMANTRAQLDVARTELARSEQLLADQATSKREYEDIAAKARQLDAQVRANQADIDMARLNLSYTRVIAPISGRVGRAEITVGNLVQGEGPNSPRLTTVVASNPVYAAFEVDERAYLKYVAKARARKLPVGVGLADEVGFPQQAVLEFVDNRLDPQSGTVRLRATLANPDGRYTPGLFARVKLGDTTAPRRAVLVADRAIGTDQSKRFVLVVNGENKAQYREVKVGRSIGALRVIEDGLKPGELVVVNGLQRVRPGAPVTPQQTTMEATSEPLAQNPAPARKAAAAERS